MGGDGFIWVEAFFLGGRPLPLLLEGLRFLVVLGFGAVCDPLVTVVDWEVGTLVGPVVREKEGVAAAAILGKGPTPRVIDLILFIAA